MILSNDLKTKVIEEIIKVCKEEIKEESNKELLGLTVDYFYDGKAIAIGCEIHIFDNDEEVEEGYTEHVLFTLNSDEIDSELVVILKQYDEETRFQAIEQAAKEIKECIETINWSSVVRTYEDMFIDLELYD